MTMDNTPIDREGSRSIVVNYTSMKILVGRKMKMTRTFDEDGFVKTVTAVDAKPTKVFNVITNEKNGYNAVKVKVENRKKSKYIEFRADEDLSEAFKVGDKIGVKNFNPGDKVKVIGKSKGKGFSGVIKRYGFSRGPETHGSGHHRRVGSIGSMFPQHVMKGKKMPGRAGNHQVTVKNLEIIDVDIDKDIILVSGAIPGSCGSEVRIISE